MAAQGASNFEDTVYQGYQHQFEFIDQMAREALIWIWNFQDTSSGFMIESRGRWVLSWNPEAQMS